MSKKDYIAIAEVFRRHKKSNLDAQDLYISIANDIADILSDDNPNFSYQRFWDYINETV